ncbi:hypothetical protein [Actinoplanes sp. TFC3]|uniref:hypothetical protein n=1 Tax=Actinoplanes sp. TFC3 TaxID=1710355 RepID=UPI000831272D|nr:hypothetical protein [Actinoplanes sp. TFC3]
MARLPRGTALLRRYVLLDAIGHGGVSTVYRAIDIRRGRRLAIKILATAPAGAGREALITHRLRHPAGPKIFEYGEATAPAAPRSRTSPLELLDGVSLAKHLVKGRLDWPGAVGIAAMFASAGRCGQLAPTPVLAVAGLPPELRDLVRDCMAKRPADRPASAEVARRLSGIR